MSDEKPIVTLDAVPYKIRPLANTYMAAFNMLLEKGLPPMTASGTAMMDVLLNVNAELLPPDGEEPYTLAEVQTFAHNMARMAMVVAAQQGPPKPRILQ